MSGKITLSLYPHSLHHLTATEVLRPFILSTTAASNQHPPTRSREAESGDVSVFLIVPYTLLTCLSKNSMLFAALDLVAYTKFIDCIPYVFLIRGLTVLVRFACRRKVSFPHFIRKTSKLTVYHLVGSFLSSLIYHTILEII